MLLKISQNLHASARVLFLLKLLTEWLQLYWKETLGQEISYEFCEIPKNISFTENQRTTASGNDSGDSLVFWRNCEMYLF